MTPDFRQLLNFGLGLWAILAAFEVAAYTVGRGFRCKR